MTRSLRLFLFVAVVTFSKPCLSRAGDDGPKSADPRLVVTLFAKEPDIVTPVACTLDAKGRLLVIESHTHFRPKDYKGPAKDRIRICEDTDGDGRADKFTTFFEGATATMDIALHPEGWIYVATRNEILRMKDTDGDDKADMIERVIFLDTKGDYPHNGIAGLSFDAAGGVTFGLGENLGADYTLQSSRSASIRGGGEGGGVFHCLANGEQLRRVATGFWNPFGTCRDPFGRIFAIDNDPDAMPPCRLMHVIKGADFGYQFRYGRTGRHPFQAWNGELEGTLPMMSGTGEGPCEVLSYDSDGLPNEYRSGTLFVTAWADHRVEKYEVHPNGASYKAVRKPFVQGGKDFRPVGLAVAPDGSLFITDWVLRDYNLHGKGAIWRLHWKDRPRTIRSDDPRKNLFSTHGPLRQAAARELFADRDGGRKFLEANIQHASPSVRAAILDVYFANHLQPPGLENISQSDSDVGVRAMAVAFLAARGIGKEFVDAKQPGPVRLAAVPALTAHEDVAGLVKLLDDPDPFLRAAAVDNLGSTPMLLAKIDIGKLATARARIGVMLAYRAVRTGGAQQMVQRFLADTEPEVRFHALKWVADDELKEQRATVAKMLEDPKLSPRLFFAASTALARAEGRPVHEDRMADFFARTAVDAKAPANARAAALRNVPAAHKSLTKEALSAMVVNASPALSHEAMRVFWEKTSAPAKDATSWALDATKSGRFRADAIVLLSLDQANQRDLLLKLAGPDQASQHDVLNDEALRSLTGAKLTDAARDRVEQLSKSPTASTAALARRVLGQPVAKGRPQKEEIDRWADLLAGTGDADAGERIFFHPKLAGCVKCHRIDGRGANVGPDLSSIGRTERKALIRSIVDPSHQIAPYYQSWILETNDGKTRTGMLIRTYLDEVVYLDAKGDTFKLNTRDIVETRPSPASIMPDGLVDGLTDQELRDLLAYLESKK